jgi:hypothetical protein
LGGGIGTLSACTWLSVIRPTRDPSGNVTECGNTVKATPGTPLIVSTTSSSPPTILELVVSSGGR